MKDFRKKGFRNFIYSRLFILVLLCFTALVVVSLVDLIKKNREARANTNLAKEELGRLQERSENIAEKIERFSTPLGQEQAVREKFAFKKPGEGEVIITEEPPKEAAVAETKPSFWTLLKNLFR